jgi:DTW domain-containing protein YfiP
LDAAGLHINNPLEFIAAIVNLCLLLKRDQLLSPCKTGYIIDLLLDNTSALSWLKVMAANQNPNHQPLACFASMYLIHTTHLPSHI